MRFLDSLLETLTTAPRRHGGAEQLTVQTHKLAMLALFETRAAIIYEYKTNKASNRNISHGRGEDIGSKSK